MKIAFLSDVHGNLPALRSALMVADGAGAERLVVAGDSVGDGPFPREVLALLRERDAEAIRGDMDGRVLRAGTKHGKLERRLAQASGSKGNRLWTALQLREAPERSWLAELPAELSFEVCGRRVLVVHGSPLGDTDCLYPSLTPEGLQAKLAGREGERPALLVCGHSHVPFARRVDGVVVVNCGSVGRPADGDPRGSMALVELGNTTLRAEILRFPYPVEAVAEAIAIRGVPDIDADEYRRGVMS